MEKSKSRSGFKIGSRILDENELKVLLPSYDNIFNQIDKFRDEAKNINEKISESNVGEEEKFDLKKDYNNVFSILGGRGTGKTSALVTVRHRILNYKNYNDNKDIIMPLIVPDDMGEISDTLGWIIACLGKEVEQVEYQFKKLIKKEVNDSCHNKYTELYDKYCRKNQEIKIVTSLKKIQKAYHFRKENYQQILAQEYVGKNEYVGETKEALEADQNLIKNFFVLIDELIIIKRELNMGEEPLIYFFFDDVDISANRGPDVISTVMRYLTHPNIVTFICGDYKVFSEMLTLDFLQKENLIDTNIMEKIYTAYDEKDIEGYLLDKENTALNLRKIRGYDFLKKILPPALRYEMPQLVNESKANFKYSMRDIEEDYKEQKKYLDELQSMNEDLRLIDVIERNFYTGDEIKEGKSFLRYRGEILYSYFEIFDKTPRGLINPYYYLYQMLLDKKPDQDNWTSISIKQLLDIIVNSSLILGSYRKLIDKVIKIDIKNEENYNQVIDYRKIEYYIDYSYLEGVFEEYTSKGINIENKDNYDDFILLFTLAHFFENILVLMNRRRNTGDFKVHGGKFLSKILNRLNIKGMLYPEITNVNRSLYFHHILTDSISKTNREKIFNDDERRYFVCTYFNSLKKLSMHERNIEDKESLIALFEDIYVEDREWVKCKVKQLLKYGRTNKNILEDVKKQVEIRLSELRVEKDIVLENEIVSNFEKSIRDFQNKQIKLTPPIEIYKSKLQKILNSTLEKKCSFYNLEWYQNEMTDIVKELVVHMKYVEDINKHISEMKLELNNKNKIVNDFEERHGTVVNTIIENRRNINNNVSKLENELKLINVQFILKDTFNYVRYFSFDDNMEEEIIGNNNEMTSDGGEWEVIFRFEPQKVASRYGVEITNKNNMRCSFLWVKKDVPFDDNMKYTLTKHYLIQEELKVLKNYVIPEINIDNNKFVNLIRNIADLNMQFSALNEELNSRKDRISKLSTQLQGMNVPSELLTDIVNIESLITQLSLDSIREAIRGAILYKIKNSEVEEITQNIINLYEDILDFTKDNVYNSMDEQYVIMTKEGMRALNELRDLRISSRIDRRINSFLNHYDCIDKVMFDNFIQEIDFWGAENRYNILNGNGLKLDDIEKSICTLKDLKAIPTEDNNTYQNEIEKMIIVENVKFIIYDYIQLLTLAEIIKAESNKATKALREEVVNLFKNNSASLTNKFSSLKRFIESLHK